MSDGVATEFLNRAEAAQLLGVSKRTLERWAITGEGPPWRCHGRRVLFARGDLLAWSLSRMRASTSSPAAA